ncbi:hypothetical protein BDP27DRAFT_1345748 [Rhodocollybia butyracea]|uniref:Uncharacterized protein n=1 Tax=Rhodocollybia butyracea TaxID=206335 RepID=A0A9P5TX12_9AGAR|nr:hypothetical protein BDP27DRAFT_1345748 [Rhodocollybia butyracea]
MVTLVENNYVSIVIMLVASILAYCEPTRNLLQGTRAICTLTFNNSKYLLVDYIISSTYMTIHLCTL